MPDRDVRALRIPDKDPPHRWRVNIPGQAGFDLLSVCEDNCETTGPQITTFWGLRYATVDPR